MMRWVAVAVLLSALLGSARLPRLPSLPRRPRGESEVEVARLLAICLSAGLPLGAALARLAREVSGALQEELAVVARRARSRGLALALVEAEGRLSELAQRLARAQVTGASMGEAVATYVRAKRAEAHFRDLQRARTLPIKLIVPVALLLLPGFLALVIGPTVLQHAGELIGPVGG